jgi:hypothetical protein
VSDVKALIMVVTAADRAAANAQASVFDPDTGGDKTFDFVMLSASGSAPATHYATEGIVTAATYSSILTLQLTTFPDASVYRGYSDYDDEEGITRHTFEEVLADLGLQRIGD